MGARNCSFSLVDTGGATIDLEASSPQQRKLIVRAITLLLDEAKRVKYGSC
jgi:hypothetical protein